ncbi:MAG: hypothetical protein NTY30_03345 [Candidatus Berkelbacteria bacterium]|nr:hypothetical protein [Candidatus Berkelbacteria bacterium]
MTEKVDKEITINDLASKVDILTSRMDIGFASTNKNHNDLAEKVDILADRMDTGFASTNKNHNNLASKVDSLTNKMEQGFGILDTKIDTKIDDLAASVANYSIDIQNRFDNTDNQIKTLNSKFDLHDGEFKILRSQMGKGFRELQKEYEDIKSRLERIE